VRRRRLFRTSRTETTVQVVLVAFALWAGISLLVLWLIDV
jgi:hypothetical protein